MRRRLLIGLGAAGGAGLLALASRGGKLIGDLGAPSTSVSTPDTVVGDIGGEKSLFIQNPRVRDLLRSTYVHSAGHCAFTESERTAAYQVFLERLDTGRWPETSAQAMNARASALNLGAARYWDYTPPAVERDKLRP